MGHARQERHQPPVPETLPNEGHDRAPHHREHAALRRAGHHEPSARRQKAAHSRERAVGGDVEDHVVALWALGDVLARVIDQVVRTHRTDKVQVPCAGHRGDAGAQRLRDLNGECADAASRAVDEDALSRLELTPIAQTL